jgi:hypothetical protein
MLSILALQSGNPLGPVLWLFGLLAVVALLVIGVRYFFSLMGWSTTHPLAIMAYLIVFILFIYGSWNYGSSFGFPFHR